MVSSKKSHPPSRPGKLGNLVRRASARTKPSWVVLGRNGKVNTNVGNVRNVRNVRNVNNEMKLNLQRPPELRGSLAQAVETMTPFLQPGVGGVSRHATPSMSYIRAM